MPKTQIFYTQVDSIMKHTDGDKRVPAPFKICITLQHTRMWVKYKTNTNISNESLHLKYKDQIIKTYLVLSILLTSDMLIRIL